MKDFGFITTDISQNNTKFIGGVTMQDSNIIKFIKQVSTRCESFAVLYKDGEVVLSGDCYHDRINEKIVGYLRAYIDLDIEYELKIKCVKKCICGDCCEKED